MLPHFSLAKAAYWLLRRSVIARAIPIIIFWSPVIFLTYLAKTYVLLMLLILKFEAFYSLLTPLVSIQIDTQHSFQPYHSNAAYIFLTTALPIRYSAIEHRSTEVLLFKASFISFIHVLLL